MLQNNKLENNAMCDYPFVTINIELYLHDYYKDIKKRPAELLISGRSGTQCIAMVNFVSGTLSIAPKLAVVMSIIIIKIIINFLVRSK